VKIVSAEFVTGAVNASQYPSLGVPEFAFYGKSNTGKSSIINMIVNRQGLVKTGAKPGMTQQINFFLINEKFCLADLPGIGYSVLPGAVRKSLGPMVAEYCTGRDSLRTIFYLLDLRRKVGGDELETLRLLGERGTKVAIVGTKADKLGSNQLRETVKKWNQLFEPAPGGIFITSSLNRTGRDALLSYISSEL